MDEKHSRVTRSGSARWVCPNDRQLALRAKLRTGWSVKSTSLDSRTYDYSRYSTSCPGNLATSTSNTNFPLSEEEKERIIQVIQRAEALDISEQERVGKLVERLENMKRNVTVVTTTRSTGRSCGSRCLRNNRCVCCCALCGEKFTVLGAGPTLCRDCRKYVCQKCGIETTLATTRGSTTNLQINQRRGISTSNSSLPTGEPIGSSASKQSTPPTKVFLCRICTETREMWKKSGAWFFKSLPKYVLPEKKKPRDARRNTGWILTGGSKSLEPSEQDSSSDDEPSSRRPTRTRSFLSYSLSTDPSDLSSQKPELEVEVQIEAEPKRQSIDSTDIEPDSHLNQSTMQYQLAVPNHSSSSTTPTSPISSTSPLPPSRSSSRLREQYTSQTSIFYVRNQIGSNESVNNESSSQSESTKSSSLRGRKCTSQVNSVDRTMSRGSIELTDGTTPKHGSRRQSINSNGSTETELAQACKYEQERSQLFASRKMESSTGTPEKTEEEKYYGTLEIQLRYEPTSQCLHCKVERARGLRPMDIHGLADPFCKLNILPIESSTTTTKRLRTKTVHKTRDPEFNEQLSFYGIMENDLKSGKALHVLILQDDPAGRDFLGEAKFPLRELQPSQTKYYNVLLEDHYPVDHEEKVWGEDMSNGRGVINLTLSYSTRRRSLLVTINRANDLLPMDSNGLSDPFVKLCLTKDPRGDEIKRPPVIQNTRETTGRRQSKKVTAMIPKCTGLVHTTSVKWKTLNPEWNEEFAFETRLTDLTANALVISVWDKDFGKSNDYLGGLVLSCNSKGARLRQWIDAIKFPDHRHQSSHELTEDIAFHE